MTERERKHASNNFYRGKYLPRNGIIANAVIRDFDINCQGEMLTCVACGLRRG